MKIANQAYEYTQNQVSKVNNYQAEKVGKNSPPTNNLSSTTEQQKFDFSNMTLQDLSTASKALYDEGTLSLGQHAALSLNYGATKNGLNQASGEVSLSALQAAENNKIDVIAMQKERLKEAVQNGATPSQVQFSKSLINTLESYQYGGGGRFHTSA
ncbi:hypothetical protein J8L98_23905 [Pseudoalteromonas sp. MMG013]|uniref:hypothetical protein n=1 Tax=Pseudoalteromonas sp. MMG013 TaxID=2822687 RepID=UPI001B35ABED|nr:hypothetical protein [Pseudoalteromonas sp. MMG013]MBQ4864733.1 hypothetical protein [Pseudoalteromonas sp. MMG013]